MDRSRAPNTASQTKPRHRGSQSASSSVASWLTVSAIATASLFWWTATDRLDLPKSWIGLLFSAAALGWLVTGQGRRRIAPAFGILALLFLLPLAVIPEEMSARVEAWALVAACLALAAVARLADPRKVRSLLLLLVTSPVIAIAWLQGLGLALLNSGIQGLQGRRVLATLGGPDHLGWLLAGLVPWAASWAASWVTSDERKAANQSSSEPFATQRVPLRTQALRGLFLASVLGALVLSGSRAAWASVLAGLLTWLLMAGRSLRNLVAVSLALALGLAGALGADALSSKARLSRRAGDLVNPSGQAAGRLYLFRVQAHCLTRDLRSGRILGRGPEAVQREWPACQRSYLARHPRFESFRSDLRQAHLDLAEFWTDYGLPGIVALVWLLWLLWKKRTWKGDPALAPAAASLAALFVAGLGGSPGFFAPTALLMALDLGLLLPEKMSARENPGQPRASRSRRWKTAWPALALCVLVLAGFGLLTRRLLSEWQRTEATKAREAGRIRAALHSGAHATELDARNPRAWIEFALDQEMAGDRKGALSAWKKASRDLPSDAVMSRINRLRKGP